MSKERKRLPVSVSAAVFIEDENGRLLLLQQAAQSKGFRWGPPAGGMLPFEDPVMTAKREVKEEIDVEVELVDLIGIYTVSRGPGASGLAFVFRAKISKGEIKPAEGEIKAWRFFTEKEIEKLINEAKLYKPEYNIPGIEDWKNGRSYPIDPIRSIPREG